jgi:hypothetical protein
LRDNGASLSASRQHEEVVRALYKEEEKTQHLRAALSQLASENPRAADSLKQLVSFLA